jgi:hypothetical protein
MLAAAGVELGPYDGARRGPSSTPAPSRAAGGLVVAPATLAVLAAYRGLEHEIALVELVELLAELQADRAP